MALLMNEALSALVGNHHGHHAKHQGARTQPDTLSTQRLGRLAGEALQTHCARAYSTIAEFTE